MSRINDLIRQLCPDGVEFKPLSEIGQLVRGSGMPKTDFTEEGVGAIHYGQIYTYYGTWATETVSFVAPETAARLAKVDPGDVIITNTSENLEDVGKAVAWLGTDRIVTGGHATVLKHKQNPKFIAYWLQTSHFYAQKKKLASGTKVIDVSAEELGTVRVPIPPAEVQEEIVGTLDRFQSLEAELASQLDRELTARRVQHIHYRATLLAFDEAVPRFRLGDLATVQVGQAPPAGVISDSGQFPFVNAGTTESGRALRSNTDGGTVTIPSRGQGGVGVVGYQQEKFWCGPLCYRIASTRTDLRTRFLYHYLKSIQPAIRDLQQTGGTPALNRKELILVEVAVPPVDEQDRIVNLLDNYDTLVNELIASLPAESRARDMQYEHYRDRLLSFEELPS